MPDPCSKTFRVNHRRWGKDLEILTPTTVND